MAKISKASYDEYEKLIDTANTAFNIKFEQLLPKLYSKKNFSPESHYVVKEDEKICAVVGYFKNTLSVLDKKINIGGIGTVCVHPDIRSKGYMKNLMSTAINDMKKDGIDLAYLDGNRKRYEYFNFTPSGTDINFYFDKANIKHSIPKENSTNQYQFKEVSENDFETLESIINLFNKKKVKAKRDINNFYDIAKSWNNSLYCILKDNEFIGYCISSSDKSNIFEFELVSYDKYVSILSDYLDSFNIDNVCLSHVPIYDNMKVNLYSQECSSFNMCHSKNFSVFNFKNVICAFLKLKSTYSNLDDGVLVIDIENYEKVKIEVYNQQVSVSNTTETTDIKLSYLEAVQLIFGYYSYFSNIQMEKNWFPIPLHFDIPDSV